MNRGQTYIQHIPQNKIQQFVQSKHFGATTDFSRLAEVDAILICVPTPLDQRREPDLSYVQATAEAIRPHLQRGQLVVLESTTYPGTTEELVLPVLEATGMKCPVAHGTDNEQIAPISSWRFHRSAKIPETSNTGWRKFRRSWAG